MKKIVLIFGMLLLMQNINATTIKLEADRQELIINETIKFHLEIHPDKPVGGNLAVYRETESNRFTIVRILYSKPSPGQCYTCVGDRPLSEDLSKDFYFFPRDEGNYYAEANFGSARDRADFKVTGIEKTSTTMGSTTTSPTTTTTAHIPSTTIMSTILVPTTTTLQATTSIIPKKEKSILDDALRFVYVLIFFLVTSSLLYTLYRIARR